MLAINVSIPNLMIARLVQFWPWQLHMNNKHKCSQLAYGLETTAANVLQLDVYPSVKMYSR